MRNFAILYPMFALAAWTMLVLLLVPVIRIRAGLRREVRADLAVVLAWVYVGLRVVHSVIHLSYNRVVHRLTAFALSCVVLLALWVTAFLHLAANPLT